MSEAVPSRTLTLWCGAATGGIAALVLVGWAFDVRTLKSVLPTFISMKPNTAVGLVTLGVALLLARSGRSTGARLAAAAAALIGAVTLAEYLFSWNAGVDELLFRDTDAAGGRFPSGRLAPVTAVSFLLLATSTALLTRPGPRAARSGQALTLVTLVIAFQALLAYGFGITYSFGAAYYTQIAVHTAALLVLLGIGLLALRPGEGVMAIFLAPTQGGVVARRLIGSALLVPPAVNFLQILGQHAGLYDADFGVLLRVVGNVVFFAAIVMRTASALHVSDLARLESDAALKRLNTELEQRVARRTEELSSAMGELEAFSFTVSHDLRAPLRAMDGFSAALEEDFGPALGPEARGHLGRIRSNVVRMTQLVDGLLDLARLSRAEIAVTEVNLSMVAREILDELRRQEPQRAVAFSVAEGLTVKGDARLLRALLDNLLRNAWKFTGQTAAANIEVGRHPSGAFYVRDNGAGFDMEHAQKLFGVFQRLHRQSDFPGTGVGLATVQRIVRRHEGKVWAEAAVGRGATFFFQFAA